MKTYKRFVAILLLCLISSTALADIVTPESLHRIGYEVLVYATGAAAALGGGLLARYRKRKVRAAAEPIAEWKTEDCVTAEERSDIEVKLNAGIPFIKDVFDQRYEELLPKWLAEDKKLPKRYTFPYYVGRRRMSEWKLKNETLLKEILVSDGELVQRFTGVPLEYLRDRLMKPMPDDFTGGCFAGDPTLEIRRKLERRRKVIRTLIQALVLLAVVYLSGMIVLALGVVEVSAPNVAMKVFKIVFYPLLPVIGVGVILFASWIAWGFVVIPLNRWCREKRLQRMAERRGKLLNEYRGERRWRIPVFDIASSRQQMQILSKDGVVVTIGGAMDASLRLKYPGVARHHAEIYFDKWSHALGGCGFAMRGLGRSLIGEYVEDRLPKKEKTVDLNVGREICVGPYAILKVVSVPNDKDNAFVFELVDGKRHEEKVVKMPQPGTSTGQLEPSENTVPFVCDGVHKQPPLAVGGQGGIVLGRSCRSDVRLYVCGPADVSGKHVEIVREGDQILAVCLSPLGMFVNDMAVERSGRRQLHEGDCMRIGQKSKIEVHVVRLPKDGDDVMVLRVQDCRGTRAEVVRLPMAAECTSREEECLPSFGFDDAGQHDDASDVCCDDGFPAADGGGMMCTKPVIYLYPQSPIKCSVCVRFNGKLTCTYPTHGADGWRDFVAAPDGTLTFPDAQKFYCLYWEGTTPTQWDFSKGYCVRGGETGELLADILAKMGLSFREANEFIIYWLPRMQGNSYNVIAFQGENYTQSAKLEIEPKPDSILRVFMAWKASDCPVDIPAPEIKSFGRKGFTVVEWGGTEVGK